MSDPNESARIAVASVMEGESDAEFLEKVKARHARTVAREEKRAKAQADYERISESATRGAGQTPYIAAKLAKLRATVNKLGGFK